MRILRNSYRWKLALSLAAGVFGGDLAADASRVAIELQGQIAPKCGLSGADGQLAFGSLGAAGARQEIAFTVNCNTPYTYAISSAHGEMRVQDEIAGAAGLISRFPYRVLLTIPTDDGGTLRKNCDSAQLAADISGQPGGGCEAESGETTSMGKTGALTVSWDAAGGPLMAGHYSDDLRISVAAKY